MESGNRLRQVRLALFGTAAMALAWSPAAAQDGATQTGAGEHETAATQEQVTAQDESTAVQNGGDTLGEIVVTAERRSENVQKAAVSISVRSGEELMRQGRFSLGAILQDVPGVTGDAAPGFGGTGADNAGAGLVIRGISSNTASGSSTVSTAAAAAIYVDGVFEGVGRDYDIGRVEVLRGPQGTLYGRSATSGLVAFHTRNPDLSDLGADAMLEAGNYKLRHVSGALNVPLVSDVLALRVSANHYERDGYYGSYKGPEETPGGGKGGAVNTDEARLKLLFQPSDQFSLLLGTALQYNTSYSGNVVSDLSDQKGKFAWQSAELAKSRNHYWQFWGEMNWNLGFGVLTYLPAYRTWNQNSVSITAPGRGANVGIIQTSIYTPKDHFNTQELRLASNKDSKLIWQIGALYYDNRVSNSNVWIFKSTNRLFTTEAVQKKTIAFGIFSQATYPISDDLRVTAGVRWDYTKVDVAENYTVNVGALIGAPVDILQSASLSGDAGRQTFRNWTYKARVEHDLSSRNLVYAGVSTGFSPGDVTQAACLTGGGVAICPLILKAETLTSYEIGSKNRFLGGKLQLNGDIFYNDYGAFQTGALNVSGDPNVLLFQTLAVPLKSKGLEVEALYQITAADRLNMNVGYADSRYHHKPAAFAVAEANNKVPSSAVTANASYDHLFDLGGGSTLDLRGALRYASAFNDVVTAPQSENGGVDLARVGAHTLVDANLTWASANHAFTVTAWARNLLDKNYAIGASAGTNTAPFLYQYTIGEPRTFGVTLNASF